MKYRWILSASNKTMLVQKILHEFRVFNYPRGRSVYKKVFLFLFSFSGLRKNHIPKNKGFWAKVLRDINNGGASVRRLQEFSPEFKVRLEQACEAALTIHASKRDSELKVENNKSFLNQYSLQESRQSAELKAIFDLILCDEITKLCHQYFGVVPLLTRLDLVETPANQDSESGKLSGSQLFHTDHEDSTCLKFFIPLRSISNGDGPTEYILAQNAPSLNPTIVNKPRYMTPGRRFSHSDQLGELNLDDKSTERFIAGKGDVLIADTCRVLHRGARLSKNGRLYLYAHFSTPLSFVPIPLNLLGFPFKNVYPLVHFSKNYADYYKTLLR